MDNDHILINQVSQIREEVNQIRTELINERQKMDQQFKLISEQNSKIINMLEEIGNKLNGQMIPNGMVNSFTNGNDICIPEVEFVELVDLYPNSKLKVDKARLQNIITTTKSATTLAIALLPILCDIDTVYRRSLSGSSPRVSDSNKEKYVKKLPLDATVKEEIHQAAKHYRTEKYNKQQVNLALTNHLLHLNKLFQALKEGRQYDKELLSECSLTNEQIRFPNFSRYVNDRTLFNNLDTEIDTAIIYGLSN